MSMAQGMAMSGNIFKVSELLCSSVVFLEDRQKDCDVCFSRIVRSEQEISNG